MVAKKIYNIAIKSLLVSLVFILINSCLDEYIPKVDRYENLLVVDGNISNQSGPYVVRLSASSAVSNPQYKPVSDATVSIESNMGESETLTESEDGIYHTHADGIQGITGRSYRLRIITHDGKEYESHYELLKPAVPIDSLYTRQEYHQDPIIDQEYGGLQFYINTGDRQEDTTYYLWKLEKTYQFQSDYLIKMYFDGQLSRFPQPDSFYNCWKSAKIPEIFTYSTVDLDQSTVKEYPLHYVNTENRELSIRYSLWVEQYSISEAAHRYWQQLKDQNIEEGALYTQQPYQVRGNIYNIHDEDEAVLGYFMVAGSDSKRLFVDRPNLIFNYPICSLGEGDYDAFKYIGWTDKKTWPLYVVMDTDGAFALPHQDCLDCRRKGGSIEKPVFWDR